MCNFKFLFPDSSNMQCRQGLIILCTCTSNVTLCVGVTHSCILYVQIPVYYVDGCALWFVDLNSASCQPLQNAEWLKSHLKQGIFSQKMTGSLNSLCFIVSMGITASSGPTMALSIYLVYVDCLHTTMCIMTAVLMSFYICRQSSTS